MQVEIIRARIDGALSDTVVDLKFQDATTGKLRRLVDLDKPLRVAAEIHRAIAGPADALAAQTDDRRVMVAQTIQAGAKQAREQFPNLTVRTEKPKPRRSPKKRGANYVGSMDVVLAEADAAE